jgi:hypothetical protein
MTMTMDSSRIKDKNPDHRYVLKNIDKEAWVTKSTPVTQTDDPQQALGFRAAFLKSTCWDWQIFYVAVPIEQHQRDHKKVKQELRTYPETDKVSEIKRSALIVKGALKPKPKTKPAIKATVHKKGK